MLAMTADSYLIVAAPPYIVTKKIERKKSTVYFLIDDGFECSNDEKGVSGWSLLRHSKTKSRWNSIEV